MIKTLRITSIIAVILAAVLLVFSVVFGARGDEQLEQILNLPSTVEKFKEARDEKADSSESQISPLVKQAEAFGRYLNPPSKPKVSSVSRQPSSTPRPVSVSPKFKLIATSFHASEPNMSLALIDEPGKGLRWVRQSNEVGHLLIEQIKDGFVVIRDGQRTYQLEPDKLKEASLVEGSPVGKAAPEPTPASSKLLHRAGAESVAARKPLLQVPRVPATKADFDFDEVAQMSDEERAKWAEKFLAEVMAMRVSDEEAEKLGHLGQQLEDVNAEPNQAEQQQDTPELNSSDKQ